MNAAATHNTATVASYRHSDCFDSYFVLFKSFRLCVDYGSLRRFDGCSGDDRTTGVTTALAALLAFCRVSDYSRSVRGGVSLCRGSANVAHSDGLYCSACDVPLRNLLFSHAARSCGC